MSVPAPRIDAANDRRAPQGEAPAAVPGMLPQVLADALGAALAHPRLEAAAPAFLHAVATGLAHDRVALGLRTDTHVQVIALSDGTRPHPGAPLARHLGAAMDEALDQRASLLVPETRSQAHPRITQAHEKLRRLEGGVYASVPVVVGGHTVGALTAWRVEGRLLAGADLDRLEQVAVQAAPLLHLMHRQERPIHKLLAERLRDRWADLQAPQRRALRSGLAVAGAALAVLALWPMSRDVGGTARVEGAVQRVLAAPADGFIGQVHARPGQAVRAGQVLVELSGQELELERSRWLSQLEQYRNALAAAAARSDRAQMAVQHARTEEAEAQLALAESRLARSRVQAPFDGVLVQGDLSQQLGAPVQQGAPLMTVAPRDQYRVVIEVDERDIAALQVGQRGTLALSALPWDTLALQVQRITPMAKAVEGRNVFEVEAALSEARADLRPGLAGSARIETGRSPWLWSVLRHPVAALRLAAWRWLG